MNDALTLIARRRLNSRTIASIALLDLSEAAVRPLSSLVASVVDRRRSDAVPSVVARLWRSDLLSPLRRGADRRLYRRRAGDRAVAHARASTLVRVV